MRGRPPIPIHQKSANGDTRKLGARKFEAAMAQGFEPIWGRPDYPAALEPPEMPEKPGPDASPDALEAYEAEARRIGEIRTRLEVVRQHWESTADALDAEGILAVKDEPLLTVEALLYANIVDAGRNGNAKALDALSARYFHANTLLCMNRSAEARLVKKETSGLTAAEEMCS